MFKVMVLMGIVLAVFCLCYLFLVTSLAQQQNFNHASKQNKSCRFCRAWKPIYSAVYLVFVYQSASGLSFTCSPIFLRTGQCSLKSEIRLSHHPTLPQQFLESSSEQHHSEWYICPYIWDALEQPSSTAGSLRCLGQLSEFPSWHGM